MLFSTYLTPLIGSLGEMMAQTSAFFTSQAGQVSIVIVVFLLTIIAFIADKVRSDIVALSSLARPSQASRTRPWS